MSAPDRCVAAHIEDPTPCEGPREAVRVADRIGGSVLACVHHGARLYASLDGARVYPQPGHDGAAIEVYYRAQRLRPFPWMCEGGAR